MGLRIVILGAGVCGLAAAHRLLQNDPSLDVTILESEDRPGGLARSLTVDGQVTDLGPHRIFTELPDVQAFLEDLVGDELETVRRRSKMWLQGGWIEYPPKPAEIARHLGIGEVARAGLSYLGHKAARMASTSFRGEESFESLMKEAFGPELYRLLIGPYARKVWKLPPSELHADIARIRVSAGGLDQMVRKLLLRQEDKRPTAVKQFYYIAGGVERLVGKLREGVEARGGRILLGRTARSLIRKDGGSWQVNAEGPRGGNAIYTADVVISTVPVGDLLAMLLPLRPDPRVERARGELRFIENFLVCFVANRPRVTDAQWLYFPEKDTLFNRGYEPKNFHQSMGEARSGMIVLEVTCHPGSKIWRATDRQLVRRCLQGLERTGILRPDEVRSTLVHRIRNTYPLYDLEYRDRLARIWSYLREFPSIISTGRQGLFLHNNMDHSIHMGFRAAERIAERPSSPAPAFYNEISRFQSFRIVD